MKTALVAGLRNFRTYIYIALACVIVLVMNIAFLNNHTNLTNAYSFYQECDFDVNAECLNARDNSFAYEECTFYRESEDGDTLKGYLQKTNSMRVVDVSYETCALWNMKDRISELEVDGTALVTENRRAEVAIGQTLYAYKMGNVYPIKVVGYVEDVYGLTELDVENERAFVVFRCDDMEVDENTKYLVMDTFDCEATYYRMHLSRNNTLRALNRKIVTNVIIIIVALLGMTGIMRFLMAAEFRFDRYLRIAGVRFGKVTLYSGFQKIIVNAIVFTVAMIVNLAIGKSWILVIDEFVLFVATAIVAVLINLLPGEMRK